MECTKFANWVANRASVETDDIITTLCHFLDDKINYCAAIDDKNNLKTIDVKQ